MCPSSSDSWCGTRGGADIIDLDRYMRGNVRPSRTLSDDSKQFERLVVDAGGVSHKPRSIASGSRVSQVSHDPDARLKRYSHDSGVSDGSYQRPRRTHRSHRRNSYQGNPNLRPAQEQPLARPPSGRVNSSSSLRAFRASCEQALIEQQQQIARVAQLCERLTEQAEKSERTEKSVQNEQLERNKCRENVLREQSEETSEISSSSRSTKEFKDEQRKDKHRSQECKTYKIIMNKLDELNRLFATRPPRPRPPPSSSSVSVCDKLVATEPQNTVIVNRVLAPTVQTGRRNTSSFKHKSSLGSNARSSHQSRVTSLRAVTCANAVDTYASHTINPNVVTKSIAKCDSSSNDSKRSAGDPRSGFDFDDPVHLYSQAKRLQALTATTRRTHSVDPPVASTRSSRPLLSEHARSGRSRSSTQRSPSVCAVCRAYCRYLRQCIVYPLFGTTDAYKCS